MPRPPKPAAVKRKVLAAVAAGLSYADAARRFKLTPPTVKRWADAARKKQAEAEEAPPLVVPDEPGPPAEEDEPEEPELPEGASSLDVARWMLRSTLRSVRAAKRDGNHAASATLMRAATEQTRQVALLEKRATADGDTVRFSRADIDEAMRGLREKFGALLARPLCCARCTRELSGEFAGYDRNAIAKMAEMGR